MKRVIIISFCIGSILLFTLTGCGKKEETNIQHKLDAELEYVEDLIFKIANKYVKGEYEEDEVIKWDEIKPDIEKINDTWNTLILDLTEVNVSNEHIMGFSSELNNLMISVSKEDEIEMMNKLDRLCAKIIVFKQAYSEDKNQIEKNKIKNDVLSIFCLVNAKDYAGASTKIASTVETYKGLMNDMNYAEENKYNLNKIYVLLEEYRNSIQTQNYDLIRMKYIVTVENL